MQKLPPELDILVRDAVEAEVTKRVTGYFSTFKVIGALLVFSLAAFGLKTCTDIEENIKIAYAEELKSRLNAEEGSSDISRYSKQLKELYSRGFLDSTMLRAKIISQNLEGALADKQIPTEDLKKLVSIAQNSQSSEDDFRTTIAILKIISTSSDYKTKYEIMSGLAQAISDTKEKPIMPSWRKSTIINVLTESNYQDATNIVRTILIDPSTNGDLLYSAISYEMRLRDKESIEILKKLTLSEDLSIGETALTAIALIIPTDPLIQENFAKLSANSSNEEIARAIVIAANIAKEMNATSYDDSRRIKWKEAEYALIKKIFLIGIESKVELRAFWENRRSLASRVLEIKESENFMISFPTENSFRIIPADLISGATNDLVSQILLESYAAGKLSQAMKFFGAIDELAHPTAVALELNLENSISTKNLGHIGFKEANFAVMVNDPDPQSDRIYVAWRDSFGFVRVDEMTGLEGTFKLELILMPI